MKMMKENQQIKCDTILCNKISTVRLSLNSYKGDMFLCGDCFTKLKCLLKKDIFKDDKKN